MSSNPLRLRFLFKKYVENTCTQQELEEFWVLVAEHSANDLIDADLKGLWEKTEQKDAQIKEVDWNAAYERLQRRMDDQKTDPAKVIVIKRRNLSRVVAAAAVFFCIVITYLMFRQTPAENKLQEAQNNASFQTLRLSDGTIVTLNRQSKLSYPVHFNGDTREVYLTGEAFFDVAHNKEKPFIVHTGSFVTKVLGTAFNIRAYDADPEVKVIVKEGKVQVQNEKGLQKKTLGVLLPGEQLTIDKESATASLAKVNVDDVLEWKSDGLKFENITFEKAARIFSRHYNVSIQFRNSSLLNCQFTGDFSDDNLVQALDVICTLTNASWKKNENGIIWIEGRGCQ